MSRSLPASAPAKSRTIFAATRRAARHSPTPRTPSRRCVPSSGLLKKHVAAAGNVCPSLKQKHVTFHCLRHTTAMDLLHAGVEQTVIALWLGHESIETT
nr:tyrosine-type recombinase/integrase [Nitrospirillum amazonense]